MPADRERRVVSRFCSEGDTDQVRPRPTGCGFPSAGPSTAAPAPRTGFDTCPGREPFQADQERSRVGTAVDGLTRRRVVRPPRARPACADRHYLPGYTAGMRASSVAWSGHVDRSAVSVQSLHDEPDDRRWWWSRPAAERLAAIEIMRRTVYGRSAANGRLQRVLEISMSGFRRATRTPRMS